MASNSKIVLNLIKESESEFIYSYWQVGPQVFPHICLVVMMQKSVVQK